MVVAGYGNGIGEDIGKVTELVVMGIVVVIVRVTIVKILQQKVTVIIIASMMVTAIVIGPVPVVEIATAIVRILLTTRYKVSQQW